MLKIPLDVEIKGATPKMTTKYSQLTDQEIEKIFVTDMKTNGWIILWIET